MDDLDLENRLIEIGRAYATEHGWRWDEPIVIRQEVAVPGKRVWSIRTNADSRGCNITMRIRETDYSVVDAAFLPR